MRGRRIDWEQAQNLQNVHPGDYWFDPRTGWYAVCPVPLDEYGMPLLASLIKHTVSEHEDGTITVSPSILVGGDYPNSPTDWAEKHTWHGWLRNGEWTEA